MKNPLKQLYDTSRKAAGDVSSAIFGNVVAGGTSLNTKDKIAREGYMTNELVFRAISEIVMGACSIDLEFKTKLQSGDVEVTSDNEILDLLKRPNPSQTRRNFLGDLISDHRIFGEAYILKTKTSERRGSGVSELHVIPPHLVTVKKNESRGTPESFEIQKGGGGKMVIPIDPIDGSSDLLRIKTYNPLHRLSALSPTEVAATSVNIHNAGLTWNESLLKNGARLSGVLNVKSAASDQGLQRLKEKIKTLFSGFKNAGEVPVLTGEMEWLEFSKTPKDMDYEKSLEIAAKNIAMVYGVPLPLILMESATFSNMADARESLWENTILPLLNEVLEALSNWLGEDFSVEGKITPNLDNVPALENKRARKFERMTKAVQAGLITRDEARIEIGFSERGGLADELLVPANQIPLELTGIAGEDPVDPDEQQERRRFAEKLKRSGFTSTEIKKAIAEEFGTREEGEDKDAD